MKAQNLWEVKCVMLKLAFVQKVFAKLGKLAFPSLSLKKQCGTWGNNFFSELMSLISHPLPLKTEPWRAKLETSQTPLSFKTEREIDFLCASQFLIHIRITCRAFSNTDCLLRDIPKVYDSVGGIKPENLHFYQVST